MEKKVSKLELSKETLLFLDDQDLAGVGGGQGLSVDLMSVACASGVCHSAIACDSVVCDGVQVGL